MTALQSDVPLRGIGPHVFVSYSFRDESLAERLAGFLRKNGFQVRMEDETSLVGNRLESELKRRIGDVECFVQLYTEASCNSHWVLQELKFAEGIKAEKSRAEGKFTYASNELIIVPVVLHPHGLSKILGDLAFVDATDDGLSVSNLEAIKKVCLQSVRLIDVDDDLPHQLCQKNIESLFSSANLKKRVIFDASGYWLRAIDSLLEYAEGADQTDRKAKQFIIQEREHRRAVKWMLEIIDVCIEALLLCANTQASKGFIERQQLPHVLNLFYKIPFFMHFLEIVSMVQAARTIELNKEISQIIDQLNQLGNMMLLEVQDKAMVWAFREVFDGTDLQDYSPTSRQLVKLHLSLSPLKKTLVRGGYLHNYMHFPQLVEPYILGTEALPHPTVRQWAWTLFGLPQAAAQGIEVGAPYEREDRDVMYSAVNSGVGWFLDHYDHISPSTH